MAEREEIPEPLNLYGAFEGRVGEFYWMVLEGGAVSHRPENFLATFPELKSSCVILSDLSELPKKRIWLGDSLESALSKIVTKHIGEAEVCLIYLPSGLYVFTQDQPLHQKMFRKVLDLLGLP